MKIIHLTGSVSRAAGGLFESVRHLSQGVAATGFNYNVSVIGTQDDYTALDIACWRPILTGTHAIYGPKRFGYAYGLIGDLFASNPDIVHLHGVWQYGSVAVLRWARRFRRPYIISPHGMVEPWAMQQSRIKKRVAWWLFQRRCLENAACLRATSIMEAQSIRQAGLDNAIAVVPNGVVVPSLKPEGRSQNKKERTALFLSRIHPKKGLINLVKAWHAVQPVGWRLLVVGPDECGHLADVRKVVGAVGLEYKITFQGEVMGEAKLHCYRDAEIFLLPSFSENFGLVIAEALSCGVPVITTRATPWEELETHRCGWWIDTGIEPLVVALREATALSRAELSEMGQRGRQLIQDHYTWPAISRQMLSVYKWTLGVGPKPACFID